jgi:hypothetical protein
MFPQELRRVARRKLLYLHLHEAACPESVRTEGVTYLSMVGFSSEVLQIKLRQPHGHDKVRFRRN